MHNSGKGMCRFGKFMTQCQKPWIKSGVMTLCHEQVCGSVINCQKHIFSINIVITNKYVTYLAQIHMKSSFYNDLNH